MAATAERSVVEAVPRRLLIGGDWVDPTSGATLPVEVADAGPEEARQALAAAADAQESWAATPARERGEILRRAFELITSRVDDLALLMTLEMGKDRKSTRL